MHAPSLQGGKPDEIRVRSGAYNACMDVFDSDHKPVWASLAVDIPIVHHDKCRRLASHVLKAITAKSTPPVPLVKLSTYSISLRQVWPHCTSMRNMACRPKQVTTPRPLESCSSMPLWTGHTSGLQVWQCCSVLCLWSPCKCASIQPGLYALPCEVSLCPPGGAEHGCAGCDQRGRGSRELQSLQSHRRGLWQRRRSWRSVLAGSLPSGWRAGSPGTSLDAELILWLPVSAICRARPSLRTMFSCTLLYQRRSTCPQAFAFPPCTCSRVAGDVGNVHCRGSMFPASRDGHAGSSCGMHAGLHPDHAGCRRALQRQLLPHLQVCAQAAAGP